VSVCVLLFDNDPKVLFDLGMFGKTRI